MSRLKQPERISGLALSPDGETLAFSYENISRNTKWRTKTIGFYNYKTKEFSRFTPPTNQAWSSPAWSWDGEKIVFSISPFIKGKLFYDKNKFAVMDLRSSSYRIITHDWTMRFPPTFSPDGTHILYRKPDKIRTRGKTRFKHWDIWQMDVSGKERKQLTHYKYYQLSEPIFMPDGKRIIFSGQSSRSTSISEVDKFKEKYGNNKIFIIDPDNPPKAGDLIPVVQIKNSDPSYTFSSLQDITENGDILFSSITNRIDKKNGVDTGPTRGFNYDLFIRQNEENRRLTWAKSMIVDATISLNGTRVVYVSDLERNRVYSYWYLNGDGSGLTELILPDSQEDWNSIQPKQGMKVE